MVSLHHSSCAWLPVRCRPVRRLYRGQPQVEVEWTVGPIPIEDGLGKEVVLVVSEWTHTLLMDAVLGTL